MKEIRIFDVMVGERYICTIWIPNNVKDMKAYIEHQHPSLRSKNWRTE